MSNTQKKPRTPHPASRSTARQTPAAELKSLKLQNEQLRLALAEQKQVADELRASEARFRSFADHATDALFLHDDKGIILEVNQQACESLGYSREELIGLTPFDIDAEVDRAFLDQLRARLVAGETVTFDAHQRRKDGTIFPAEVHIRSFLEDGRNFGVSVVRDITERKRTEAERQAHFWFLESLDQINRAMQGTNDLDQMMSNVLDLLLSIFNCDRAWLVYPCDPDAATWQVPMERTRPEYPSVLPVGVELPLEPVGAAVYRILRDAPGPVQFNPASAHQVPLEMTQGFSVQSFIAMAFYPKVGQPWSFGLHQCSSPRVWTAEEERLFQEIGRRFSDALTSLLMYRHLRDNESQLAEAQRIAQVGHWDHDLEADRFIGSDETYRIFGVQPEAGILDRASFLELIHPDDRQGMAEAIAAAAHGDQPYERDYRVVRPDGEVRFIHSQWNVKQDESNRPRHLFGTVQDITERKHADEAQRRVNRELRAISNCNQVLMRAVAEPALLDDICRIICDEAGYRMAWVGYAENDEAKTVRPVAGAGVEDGYLVAVNITWADTERGRGPTGTALRRGESTCIQDFMADPQALPWRQAALQRGYRSSIALPLKDENDMAFGALCIYSAEPNAFTPNEIRLLEELAGDLAYGIVTLRTRAERKRAEAALHEREQHSQSLLRLSKALEGAQTYDQVLDAALDEVKTIIGYQNLWVYLLTEDKKHATALAAGGHMSEAVMTGEGIATMTIEGDRMLEALVAATEIVVIEDGRTDKRTNKEIVARLGNRTIVNVPILLLDRHLGTVGVGTFGDEGVRVPTLAEREYLSAMASHLAVTFDRIHLLEQRKQAEQERLAHLRFFEGMDRVNRSIQGTNNLEQMMSDVLDVVLSLFDCDRAFLMYPCEPEATSWKSPMERNKPEYPGILAAGLDIPMDPDVAETLRILLGTDGPIKFGAGSEHPLPADVAERFGIQSFMSMALRPRVGQPWQFGIHQCSYAREWTVGEEQLFQEIGRRLADGLTSLLIFRNLQESEAKFSTAFQFSPSASLITRAKDHVYLDANDSFLQLTGYTPTEVIGRTGVELNLWAEPDQEQEFLRLLREQGSVYNFEYGYRRKDGEVRYALISATLITLGGERCALAQSNDITERKRAEETLNRTHLLLQQALRFTEALLSAIPTPVFYKDKEGRYLGCNRAFSELMGVTPEEIKGKTVFQLWPSEHAEIYHDRDLELINNPGRQVYEFVVRDKDGLERPVVYVKDVFRDETDQAVGIVGAFLDITERKQAEEALRRLNRELRAISDCNQTLLRAVDEQTLLNDICRIVCDGAGYRMAWVGYAKNDEARTVRPIAWAGVEDGYLATANITWADAERGRGPTGTAIRSGESAYIQDIITEPQATPWRENAVQRGYRSNIALPLKDESAQTFGALTIYSAEPNAFTPGEMRLLEELAGDLAFGITTLRIRIERKRAEEALQESETRYRLLAENASDIIFTAGLDLRFTYVSPSVTRIRGYSMEEAMAQTLDQVLTPTSLDVAIQTFAEEMASEASGHQEPERTRTLELEEICKDGSTIWTETTVTFLRDSAGQAAGLIGITRDITERKRAEEEIYTLNQELEQRVIVRTAELARAHEHLRAILDTVGEGVVFTDLQGAIEYINPAMERLTGYTTEEVLGRNPRLWKSAQTPPPTHQRMWSALTRGEIWEGELINRRKDGTLYDAALTAAPLTNSDSQIVGYVGLQRDISRQKELDRMKDQFVSNVSHELRTPLANILLHVSLLERGKPDKVASYQQTLRREAERLRKMIEDLLDLSRLDRNVASIYLTPIDLNQLLEHLVADRAALAEQRGLTLAYEPRPDLPFVLTDASKIIQVASNLMTNALNYTPAGGAVNVRTEVRSQAGQRLITFTVQDTGPGISTQDTPHLFERFYRGAAGRQASAPGTGLGLAISQEIMKRLGGHITVESEVGQGAAFTVWLPSA